MRPPFKKILQTSALMTGAMALVFSSAGVVGATSVDEAIVTEDTDLNDGGTMNNVVDDGDNAHPSGKDRSFENGASGNQGKSTSDPDNDGNGPDRSNNGPDKPGGEGGVDKADQDGNNGCGNDDDFEDDNEGKCLGRDGAPGQNTPETPAPVTPIQCDDDEMAVDGDDADDVPDTCMDVEDETDEDEDDTDDGDEVVDEDEDNVDNGGGTPVPDVDAPIVGGEVVQNPVTPVVPVVRPVVPATSAVPTVSPAVPARPVVLTAAASNSEVLGTQVTRAPGSLARTGDASTNLVPFGLGLVLLGFGVQRSSKRFAAARVR